MPAVISKERLSEADTADLQAAQEIVTRANAVWEFLLGRFAARYGLKDGDEIRATGEIVRTSGEKP